MNNFCKLDYQKNVRFFVFHILFTIGIGFCSKAVLAIGNCPSIGQSPSCSVLITINPNGSLKFETDPNIGPYDGAEDTLVGVQNLSGATVFGISLTGNDIFGFDYDGATSNGNYEGPGTSFSIIDANTGTINFDNGLNDKGFIWFSLEGAPSQVKLTSSVTIDPGHGFNCPSIGQKIGAVGNVDYSPGNLSGLYLHEDDLTVSISYALRNLLAASQYKVSMTKSDVNSCLTPLERGTKANNAKSNIFVSVHVDKAIPIKLGILGGSKVLYSSNKASSKTLADLMVSQIASNLGVNNRGTETRDDVGVLKVTATRMTAVLAEVARLSNPDSDILHATGSSTKAASGIKSGIDAFLSQ
ncbi:MAG: N-acetylmuramoyl-L-alanine amidase [Methylococcales bacterium]|nr:N-acetylmuramoyl-L-alanine amidase [Methylococcales bacterium]